MQKLHFAPFISVIFALSALACSSSDQDVELTDATGEVGNSSGEVGNSTSDSESDGDGCVSSEFTPVSVEVGDRLVDVAAGRDATWLLLKGKDDVLALHEVGGARHVLEARDTTNAAISARPDGGACVVWGVGEWGAATVKSACSPSFEVKDTGITLAMATRYPVSFRDDGDQGAAVLFAETNSLDGLSRAGQGSWSSVDLMESSISFAGGPRALSGASLGSPLCFVSQGGIVVEDLSGELGTIATESKATLYEDVGCGVAEVDGSLGVFAVGGGKARFAVRAGEFGAQLVESPLDAESITRWGFGATSTHFVAAYATGGDLFRAHVPLAGGSAEVTPVALPDGAKAWGQVALTHDLAGTEILALEAEGQILVAETCAAP